MTSLPLFPTRPRQPIDLDQITAIALESSPRVRSLRLLPLIAETAIVEESSEFDPVVFAESRIDNVSDPVGNLLTTGGPPRLRSHDFAQDFGVRQRTATGGQLELSQQFGLEDSNSVFFSPRDQGNARMTLSVSHPLLNQHGKAYNTALIAIAELQRDQVSHESLRMVQDHIQLLGDSYWQLYRARAVLIQRRRHVERARRVLHDLEGRGELDANRVQILRARAALKRRAADLAKAEADVLNLETQLRAKAGVATGDGAAELLIVGPAAWVSVPVTMADGIATALQHRPELAALTEQIRVALVRHGVAESERLPIVNMVAAAYVTGLRGDSGVGNAFTDQFVKGQPGYSAGLQFEMPWGNRRGDARVRRRQLEIARLQATLQDETMRIRAEVETAVRNVRTAYEQLGSRREAVTAARAEVDYLRGRRKLLAGDDLSAASVLNFEIDAEERLADEEQRLATTQTDYAIAFLALKRSMGVLVISHAH
ncbi:MAG: TolC family protein [Pirellulaceae bacterium]|nr:TolC family protein [Pirellulaceae bacterium]